MVLVGGHTATSNLEVHDMRFVVGSDITDCYEQLQTEWWGDPDTLHLDAWGAVTSIDGHDVSLQQIPYTGENKLFFVNMGGYDVTQFDELHKNILIVAPSLAAAKHKAKESIKHWTVPHKDTAFEIEKIVPLNGVVQNTGYHIHLQPGEAIPFSFHCRYTPISKKALAKRAV